LLHLYSAFSGTSKRFIYYMEEGNFFYHHQCAASTWMML